MDVEIYESYERGRNDDSLLGLRWMHATDNQGEIDFGKHRYYPSFFFLEFKRLLLNEF